MIRDAVVVREFVPFEDRRYVHGVTFDAGLVWFGRDDEIVAFDPNAAKVVRRLVVPGASAGTAFDGQHLYQVTKDAIVVVDPETGHIVRQLPSPPDGMCSGMTWAGDALFVGQFKEMRIHRVDAQTGAITKTITSDRCVTGVSFSGGALWHAASYDGKPSELRRIADDGTIEERWNVPVEALSGIESAGDGGFWCGGEKGTLRYVRLR